MEPALLMMGASFLFNLLGLFLNKDNGNVRIRKRRKGTAEMLYLIKLPVLAVLMTSASFATSFAAGSVLS